jgi:predicted outer membrane repeat protein
MTTVTVDGNFATTGGGVFIRDTTATASEDTVFIDNTASENCGGMFLSDTAVWSGGHFSLNEAPYGGGACVAGEEGQSRMTDVVFEDNEATNSGGALYIDGDARLTRIEITGNHARWGGGIFLTNVTAYLLNSTVTNNRAIEGGGGAYLFNEVSFVVSNTDWGTGGVNNTPDDVMLDRGDAGTQGYSTFGLDESFTCTNPGGVCR